MCWVLVAVLRLSLLAASKGLLFIAVIGLLITVAQGVAMHGLHCFTAGGIFLDQRLNPSPLHWRADS